MMTARGWWFLMTAGMVAVLGVLWLGIYSPTIPILGLSLLGWFFAEWLLFAVRYRMAVGRFRVERDLVQGGRSVPAAWAGHEFSVRVAVRLDGGIRIPFAVLEDRLPAECQVAGAASHCCELVPGNPVEFEYRVTNPRTGLVRFEGVTIRIADLSGFFYRRIFVRDSVEYLVLPPLTDDEGRQRADKRFNTLPPPGVHRLRRPGSGSELMDLRDYRPGDPPKMIAWKASARRDRLITKEFESDVPVRCVLFLDASEGARVGPPGEAPIVRLATVAAGVAQAAAASRDLVGLTVFDDERAEGIAPARTQAHIIRLLHSIAEAAGRLPPGEPPDAIQAARYAYPLAKDLYPDVLESDVNSRPLGLFWRPISDSNWMWLVLALFAATSYLVTRASWLKMAFNSAAEARLTSAWWGLKILAFVLVFLPILLLPSVIGGMIWVGHGIRGLFEPNRTRTSRRKQLGALYAFLDRSGPAAIERYLHDDAVFVERSGRFLREHRVRVPVSLFDSAGNYRFRSERKVQVLADAIVRAVGRARDNELFVVLADVAELADAIEPLTAAARVARARHHQMLVLVPWPAGVPAPTEPGKKETPPASAEEGIRGLTRVVRTTVHQKYLRDFSAVRSVLTRSGAVVVRIEDGDPIQLVLDRLDRVRGVRMHR